MRQMGRKEDTRRDSAWLAKVAAREHVSTALLRKHLGEGKVVVLRSNRRSIVPLAVGATWRANWRSCGQRWRSARTR